MPGLIERQGNVSRIAVVAHKDYPGGVRERREIDALVGAGYEVDLICLRQPGQPARESRGNLRIYRMPLSHKRTSKARFVLEYATFFGLAFLALSLLQLRRHYTLVQVHNIPDVLVFAALLPKLQGARLLLDIRDPMPEALQYKYGLSASSRWIAWMRWGERVSIGFSDHVLTVHEPLRQIHIQRGCPAERISAIMNLPDERIFHSDSRPTWPRSAPPRFILIYTGTLGQRLGIQTAVRGLPALIQEMPGLRLRVIGEGEYLAELKHLVEALGVSSHVSFEPPIPLEQVPQELLRADVGIALQEGLCGEIGFPTKVGEYMAMGLPAIVSETKLTRYYFDGETVAFIPPGDEMAFVSQVRRLYTDHAFAHRLIANGYRFFETRNWAGEKARYLEIVRRLVSASAEEG